MTIVLGCMAAAGALAAALGADVEDGVFRLGLGAALLVLMALEVYYRRRYRPRRKNGSE